MQLLNTQGKIKIGITIGDISGKGPEMVIGALADNRILDFCTPIVYGNSKIMTFYRKSVSMHDFSFNIIDDLGRINHKKPNLINCWSDQVQLDPVKQDVETAEYSFKSLEAATEDIIQGKIQALITAPLDKFKNTGSSDFNFHGHNEYLNRKTLKDDSLTFLITDNIKIGLVSDYLEIEDAFSDLHEDKIMSKLKLMNDSLKNDFQISKPCIAVLGFNCNQKETDSHKELNKIIKSVIERADKQNIFCFGTYPPDSFFEKKSYMNFHAVLAMYRDQTLFSFGIPSLNGGANFTAGLPFVRTFIDDEFSYNTEKYKKANEQPLRNAIYLAIDIYRRRNEEYELRANSLRPGKVKIEKTKEDQEE